MGIFKSTDYGDSWTKVVDMGFENYDSMALELTAIVINSEDEIFVGATLSVTSRNLNQPIMEPVGLDTVH